MWDERYAEPGFAYGKGANVFLMGAVAKLPPGRALCLAAGEGRNAVYLAERGFDVTAVDQSSVGLAKAEDLAHERGVSLRTIVADLADFALGEHSWDLVVSIFAHVPPPTRIHIHEQVSAALSVGGLFVLEAYTPDQVGRGTGGPPVAGPTMTAAALRSELDGLDIFRLAEIERSVVEGRYHTGISSVVQAIARRRQTAGGQR